MNDLAATIFGSSSVDITPAQMSARAIVVLAYGVTAIRLFGRRIFGRLTPLDVVLSVLIGSNLSRTITGNSPLLATIVATTVLLGLYWFLARAAVHADWVGFLVKGREATLVKDGRIDWEEMRRHGIGPRDLEESLHAAGHETAENVRLALLERNGKISVISR